MLTGEEILRIDEQSRRRIREDIDTNFFVEAAAGSGKTSSLVDRMVAMVKAGKDISRITAITFTVNAANEFYKRFREELQKAADGEDTDNTVRERCRNALENIDLCFMGTIDSFCETVCAEHPHEAGMPADAHVAGEDELSGIYRAELAKVQNGGYGKEMYARYRRLAGYLNNADRFILGSIGGFVATRDCRRVFEPCRNEQAEVKFADIKAQLIKVAEHIASGKLCLQTGNADSRKAAEFLSEKADAFSFNWDRNPARLIDALNEIKGLRLADDPSVLGSACSSMFRYHDSRGKWYELNMDTPGTDLYGLNSYLTEERFSAMMEFMDGFSEIIGETLRKQGTLGFFDYQLCLRDMLRRDAENGGRIARHIYGRHSYFLIDEFQDTAPIQAETFFRLAAEKPEKDWRDCVPVPGSLFIVGDPKQSIYRFRGADVSSFLKVRALFRGEVGEVLHLYRNFRSTARLCGKFNDAFSRLLPVENEYQSAFENIPVPDAGDDGGITGVFHYETAASDAECSADVVKLIRALTGSRDCRISAGSGSKRELRSVQYRDIMVITERKDSLSQHMKACIEAQIPVSVEGKTVFSECPALMMAAAVLDAAADPSNAMKVYAALTCGLFDLNDMELSRYCLDGNPLRIRKAEAEPDGNHEKVISAIGSLNRMAALASSVSPLTLFNSILKDMPVIERAGTANLEYAYYAAELLADAENTGNVSGAADAAAFVSELVNNESGIERTMYLNRGSDCVLIANLHKVKGLERPVVILDAKKPDRIPRKPRGRTHRDDTGSFRYEFSVGPSGGRKVETDLYTEQKETEELYASAEKDRLVYVAGTRAGSILIVPSVKDNGKNTWKALLEHSEGDISSIFTAEAEEKPREMFDAAKVMAETAGSNVLPDDAAKEKTYAVKRPSSLDGDRVKGRKAEDSAEPDDRTVQASDTEKPGRSDAGLIGTMVHRVMEILVTSKNRVSEDEAVAAVLGEYEFSPDRGTEYEEMLRHVVNIMRNGGYGQTTDVCRDVLGELLSADEVYCEVPICLKEGTDIVHGFIDVIYRNDSGWHILDYKTDASTEGIAERHASQLAAYVKAFGELTGEKADAKIYHIGVKG